MSVAHTVTPTPSSLWRGVTDDSRAVSPGYAFVAVAGAHFDGHRYINEAVARGAAAVYVERDLPDPPGVPVFRVPDTRVALSELARRFYADPAQRLVCIGATGTNGKTTTTSLLQWILNIKRRRAGLLGTVHLDSGLSLEPALLTTPGPVILQRKMAEMVDVGFSHAVLEVSSHGIAQHRVHGIPWDIGLFTNISLDHLDFHPSLEEYVDVKARLFADLDRAGAAVVNVDDPHVGEIVKDCRAPIYTFGLQTGGMRPFADVQALRVRPLRSGSQVEVRLSTRVRKEHQRRLLAQGRGGGLSAGHFTLAIPLLGSHNVANTLGAVTAALLAGATVPEIVQGVATFPGVWRRQQRVPLQGAFVLDDACHNSSSYEALFRTIGTLNRRRTLFVNGIRGSRGVEVNDQIGSVLAQWAAGQNGLRLWITDCTDTAVERDIVTDEERAAVLAALKRRGVRYSYRPDLHTCLQELADELRETDLGVLAGAHAMDGAADLLRQMWDADGRKSLAIRVKAG